MRYQPHVFLTLANGIMSRNHFTSEKTEKRQFHATFGTLAEVCVELWEKIDPTSTMPKRVQPAHLLWALMFLKLYSTEPVLSSMVGGVDEKTFCKWAWLFVQQIAELEDEVVSNILT